MSDVHLVQGRADGHDGKRESDVAAPAHAPLRAFLCFLEQMYIVGSCDDGTKLGTCTGTVNVDMKRRICSIRQHSNMLHKYFFQSSRIMI